MKLSWQSFPPLKRGVSQLLGIGAALTLGLGGSMFGEVKPASAAEDIVFTYGQIGVSFSVDELEEFAETGVVPSKWRFYFNITGIDPEVIQTILSQEFAVDLQFADKALNTIPGEFALFSLGQIIHTRSRRANIQALRSAFVLSLVDDNKVSALEYLQNYPLQQMYVDGIKLAEVAKEVSKAVDQIEEVVQRLEAYWAIAKEFLAEIIDCDCDPTQAEALTDELPVLDSWIAPIEPLSARPDEVIVGQ